MRHRFRLRLAIGTVALCAASCRDARFDAAVRHALLCEECVAGEIDTLVTYRDLAVPRLVNELRGPTAADSMQHQRLVAFEWRGVRARRAHTDSVQLRADSVALSYRAAESFVTSYQKRALYVLFRIGTPMAKAAIRAAFSADSAFAADSLSGGLRLKPPARALADSLRRL